MVFIKGQKPHNQGTFTSDSYTSVHKWLSRNFIKLKKCEHCGSKRFIEWALKKGKRHDHNRDSYLCLCSSCHKKYDYTPERREKLSRSLKLVPHTKEWNRKATAHNKGYKHTDEAKRKMSIYQIKNPRTRNKTNGRFN